MTKNRVGFALTPVSYETILANHVFHDEAVITLKSRSDEQNLHP